MQNLLQFPVVFIFAVCYCCCISFFVPCHCSCCISVHVIASGVFHSMSFIVIAFVVFFFWCISFHVLYCHCFCCIFFWCISFHVLYCHCFCCIFFWCISFHVLYCHCFCCIFFSGVFHSMSSIVVYFIPYHCLCVHAIAVILFD